MAKVEKDAAKNQSDETSCKVKICGLSRISDIEAVNEAEPEYVGFVFVDGSRRRVTPEQALALRHRLLPRIVPVGVFVNERIDHVLALVRNGVIDAVQLHGTEDDAYVQRLATLSDKPIIRAIGVGSVNDVARQTATSADYLLLDSPGGGTGIHFDWKLAHSPNKPFFLAGGLSIENVADAIRQTKPFAVDVSSGVETNGYKDRDKILSFVRTVRHMNQESFNA